MRTLIIILGGLSLLAALYVTVANWACAIISLRNQRKGIDRHHSMIPIVSLLLAFFAMFMWPYWPGIWVLLIPVLDIANLNLLFSPVYLLVHLYRKPGPERKLGVICFTVVSLAAMVVLIALFSDDNEPRYESKKLSTWLAIYVKHAGDIEGEKAETAVRAIGTNALPCLLKWVRHEWSPSKSKQLLVVGLEWLPKAVVPSNFREWNFFMDSAFERASLAPIGFGLLGSTADVAIPELVAVANTSKDDQAIVHTMEGLRRIGPTALPALITMITNTNLTPRFYAIAAVRVFGTNAAPAVPFLIERLHDKETSIAIAAAESLRELNLEPQTTFAAWTNMLNESRPLLRVVAVHAIARCDKQAQPVLPALLRMLEDEDRHVREAATNELREITLEVFTNALPQ